MILLFSLAQAAELDALTVVQARTDMAGQPFVQGTETLAVRSPRDHTEAYGDLGVLPGAEPALWGALYVLAVDGGDRRFEYTLGRQRLDLPTAGRVMDGGHLGWSPWKPLRLDAWAGWASSPRFGLDQGEAVARLSASLTGGPVSATVGAWGERGAVHPDLRVRVAAPERSAAPELSLLVAGGVGGGVTALERARVEASLRPTGGVRVSVLGERRESFGDSPFESAILATLAPEGVTSVGAGAGFRTVTRDELWAEAGLALYDSAAGEAQRGWSASVRWRPTCEGLCVSPAWRGTSGPGGFYSAFSATVSVPVPGPLALSTYGLAAPYRLPGTELDSVLALGANLSAQPTDLVSLSLGGELAHTAIAAFDPRVWATVNLRPGRGR